MPAGSMAFAIGEYNGEDDDDPNVATALVTEDQAGEFWGFMVSQNKSLYGREQNHESQFHGFALNPVLEFMDSRCRLENNLNWYFVATGGLLEFQTLDLHI